MPRLAMYTPCTHLPTLVSMSMCMLIVRTCVEGGHRMKKQHGTLLLDSAPPLLHRILPPLAPAYANSGTEPENRRRTWQELAIVSAYCLQPAV